MRLGPAAVLVVGVIAACGAYGSKEQPAGPSDGGTDAGIDDAANGTDGGDAAVTCDASKVASDPSNCGRCGHSCLGGACANGACAPVEIGSTTSENVYALAVDATHVYWISSIADAWGTAGHLYSCPKTGCAAAGPRSLAPDGTMPGALVGDGQVAYASYAYGTRALVKLAGDTTISVPAPSHALLARIQIAPANGLRYASLYDGTDAGVGQWKGSTHFWDGSSESLTGTYQGNENVMHFVIAGSEQFLASTSALLKCGMPCDNTWTTMAASIDGVLASLTTNGSALFFRLYEQSQVLRTETTSYAPTEVLGPGILGGAKPNDLFYANGSIYVTSSAGDLFACSTTTCPARPLAHDPNLAAMGNALFGTTIGTDDSAVYYVAGSTSAWHVMKVAK